MIYIYVKPNQRMLTLEHIETLISFCGPKKENYCIPIKSILHVKETRSLIYFTVETVMILLIPIFSLYI